MRDSQNINQNEKGKCLLCPIFRPSSSSLQNNHLSYMKATYPNFNLLPVCKCTQEGGRKISYLATRLSVMCVLTQMWLFLLSHHFFRLHMKAPTRTDRGFNILITISVPLFTNYTTTSPQILAIWYLPDINPTSS